MKEEWGLGSLINLIFSKAVTATKPTIPSYEKRIYKMLCLQLVPDSF